MTTPHERPAGSRLFWLTAALGWAVIAVGLRGIFQHAIDTRPRDLARFVVGGALIHDLIVAPLVLLAAAALTRIARPRARSAITAAVIVSAVVALFSYPLVRAYGLAANNPTSLPHNYAGNLTIVLGIVWAGAALALVSRYRVHRDSGGGGGYGSHAPGGAETGFFVAGHRSRRRHRRQGVDQR